MSTPRSTPTSATLMTSPTTSTTPPPQSSRVSPPRPSASARASAGTSPVPNALLLSPVQPSSAPSSAAAVSAATIAASTAEVNAALIDQHLQYRAAGSDISLGDVKIPHHHGPAPKLHQPGRPIAPDHACSPSRHREDSRIFQEVYRHPQNNNSSQPASSFLSSTTSSFYPNVTLNNSNTYNNNNPSSSRSNSPTSASCPLCGSLRLPIVDVGAGATGSALDRKKAELQQELLRIEDILRQQRKAQSTHAANNSGHASFSTSSAFSSLASVTPRGARGVLEGRTTNPSPTRFQQQQQNTSSSSSSSLSKEHSFLVDELRSTANSLLRSGSGSASRVNTSSSSSSTPSSSYHPHSTNNNNNNNNNNANNSVVNFSVSPVPIANRTSPADQSMMSDSLIHRHQQSISSSSSSSSSSASAAAAAAAGTTRLSPGRAETAQRPQQRFADHESMAAAMTNTNPHVTALSPPRDEMYSRDHQDTLKELAMLRCEREMKK